MADKRIKKKKSDTPGRVRFYADENIEIGLVYHLRNKLQTNIISALEEGTSGRDDNFHFQEAKRRRRFLLTCDKGFLNNSRFPFNLLKGFGVIILDIPQIYPGVGWMIVWLKEHIIGSRKNIEGTKIVLHERSLDIHYINDSGRISKDIINLL